MNLYQQQKSNKYFDSWESISKSEKSKYINEQLCKIVSFAKKNVKFYQDGRLNNFAANSNTPMADIPILSSNDLRAILPPVSTDLVSTDNFDYTVFQSGGSTGAPKTTLFSHAELEALNALNARGFYAVGLTPEDKVANFWAVGGLYMTFIHINRMLQQYGCMNFPFSNHTPADFVYNFVKSFNINCFSGIASVVLNMLRSIKELTHEKISIEKVYFGGEHLYEADKRELENEFGVKLIKAPGYGTVDTWYLGYQCANTSLGTFHAHDDQVYLEIVNEETGKHCDLGEEGMLYATVFARTLTPIIRYRVGDRAVWLGDACSCGRTTPLFKLLGRGDDVLRIGYDSIDYGFIQQIVAKIPKLLGSIQIEKTRYEGKDQLIVRVECDQPELNNESAEKLENLIMLSRLSLNEFIKKGSVWPLKVELLKPGTLPRNSRTGKLKRVIDLL